MPSSAAIPQALFGKPRRPLIVSLGNPFPGLGSALLLLGLAAGAQAGLTVAALSLGGSANFALMSGLVNLVALTGVSLFGYGLAGLRPRFLWKTAPASSYWLGLVLAALGATVVLGEFSNLVTFWFPLPPGLARTLDQLTGGPLGTTLFALALVAPITEELLFRDLLLRGLGRRYGTRAGLLLSSALFAAFHLNLWQALPAFLAGLYLGRVYLVTGSLVPPMVVHGLFNGFPVTLAALGWVVPGYNVPGQAQAPGFQPPLWLGAGFVVLTVGLMLTKPWAPLSPPQDSDKLAE